MSFTPFAPIAPIDGISAGPSPIAGIGSIVGQTPPVDDDSFGTALVNAIDTIDTAHKTTDQLAVHAATGDLSAVHDYTVAATESQLMTQLAVEVRNRALDAFNDIMRMQV